MAQTETRSEQRSSAEDRAKPILFAMAAPAVVGVLFWASKAGAGKAVDSVDFLVTLKAAAVCAERFCGLSIF